MANEIENCPVCGSAPEQDSRVWAFWVKCPKCYFEIRADLEPSFDRPEEEDKARAVELWNQMARNSRAAKAEAELDAANELIRYQKQEKEAFGKTSGWINAQIVEINNLRAELAEANVKIKQLEKEIGIRKFSWKVLKK